MSDGRDDPSPDAEVTLRVTGLRKTYQTRRRGTAAPPAVDGVDLTIRPGELLVLLGPSGCGKTTLLRSIAGLERPDAGTVVVSGRPLFDPARRIDVAPERRGIGMMFQSYALWPHMTVLQNVRYPLTHAKGVERKDHVPLCMEILEQLGVAEYAERHPGQLSGGQQQRVALARALVISPALILFDEPLSNVDARVRKSVRRQIRQLQQDKQFAGVYVTHDQEEAMELADTLAVMGSGRILQIGPPDDIYHNPASRQVASFVGDVNEIEGTVTAVAGGGCTVATAIGELSAEASGAAPVVGDRGWVVIRPEDVLIEPGATDGPRGRRARATFAGAHVDTTFDVAGVPIIASSAQPIPGTADEVGLRFREGAARWLTQ